MACSVQGEVNTRIWKYFGNQGKNDNFLYQIILFFFAIITIYNNSHLFWCIELYYLFLFLYQILFQWTFFINHCIKRISCRAMLFFSIGWKRVREKQILLTSWFVLMLLTIMNLMDWIICMLLHKAKAIIWKLLEVSKVSFLIEIFFFFSNWALKIETHPVYTLVHTHPSPLKCTVYWKLSFDIF
jgi:hypothetical protein